MYIVLRARCILDARPLKAVRDYCLRLQFPKFRLSLAEFTSHCTCVSSQSSEARSHHWVKQFRGGSSYSQVFQLHLKMWSALGLSTEAQGHEGYLNKCQQVGVFDASIVQDYAV